MKKSSLAIATLLGALAAVPATSVAYAADNNQQMSGSGCSGCKGNGSATQGCKGCSGCAGCAGCSGCAGSAGGNGCAGH